MNDNPYAAPKSHPLSSEVSTDESNRRLLIRHETSVKSISTLNFLAVIAGSLIAIGLLGEISSALDLVISIVVIGLTVMNLVAGINIRRLNRTGRVLNGILFGIGLILVPVGTLISVYALWLLFGKKGRKIFSEEYRDLIGRTPLVKYRTPREAWAMLILVLLLLGATFFYFAT